MASDLTAQRRTQALTPKLRRTRPPASGERHQPHCDFRSCPSVLVLIAGQSEGTREHCAETFVGHSQCPRRDRGTHTAGLPPTQGHQPGQVRSCDLASAWTDIEDTMLSEGRQTQEDRK